MDFVQILITVLIMAVFGLILGLLAAMASKFLSVKKDYKSESLVIKSIIFICLIPSLC